MMSHQDNLRHEPIVQPPPESTVVPVSSASSASVASSQEKLSGSTKKIVAGAVALAAASVLGVLLLRKRKTPGKSNRTALPLAVSNKSATKARLRARVPVSAVSVAAQSAARSRPPLQKENDDASTLLHDLVPVLSSALSLASSWRAKRKQDDKRAGEVAALAAAMQAEAEVSAPVREDKRLDPDVVKIVPGNRWQIAWQLSRGAVNAWLDDFAPSMGAAIAYYPAFSIAPSLIIAIAIGGMIFGKDAEDHSGDGNGDDQDRRNRERRVVSDGRPHAGREIIQPGIDRAAAQLPCDLPAIAGHNFDDIWIQSFVLANGSRDFGFGLHCSSQCGHLSCPLIILFTFCTPRRRQRQGAAQHRNQVMQQGGGIVILFLQWWPRTCCRLRSDRYGRNGNARTQASLCSGLVRYRKRQCGAVRLAGCFALA